MEVLTISDGSFLDGFYPCQKRDSPPDLWLSLESRSQGTNGRLASFKTVQLTAAVNKHEIEM